MVQLDGCKPAGYVLLSQYVPGINLSGNDMAIPIYPPYTELVPVSLNVCKLISK